MATKLPDNVILSIFSFLPPKDLISCSDVCLHWNEVYQQLDINNKLWWEFTKKDFKSAYKSAARRKTVDGCNWHNIYRSLCLWPEVESANEVIAVFAEATRQIDRIRDFTLLKDSIGILKHDNIMYYDTNNMAIADKSSYIMGRYMEYAENEELLGLLAWNYLLHITRKFKNDPSDQENGVFQNVTHFILYDKRAYYVKTYHDVFMCDFNNSKLEEIRLFSLGNRIKGLNYTDKLYAITDLYEIVFYDTQLNRLEDQAGPFGMLSENNLVKYSNMQCYVKLVLGNSCPIPMSVVTEATTIVVYGNIIALGTIFGIVYLYIKNGDSANLLKTWSFGNYPVVRIEIIEIICGHKIYVGLSTKMIMIKLVHESNPNKN